MNKVFFVKLILLSLIVIFGNGFFALPMKAGNGLVLEIVKECDIQYSGDSCVAELKLTNNTGEILNGEAFLHVDYRGICGDGHFDGEGIKAQFSIDNSNWLNFSGWESGTTTVSGFDISEGGNQPKLKIETIPSLCPGEYTFTFSLKGTFEEEEYITPTVRAGGGGAIFPPPAPEVPQTETGEVTATPEGGGITTLTNPDGGKIELTIPPGAVSEDTNFTIKRVSRDSITPPSPERGLFLANELIYEIKAQRDGELITEFDESLGLIFTYTEKQIERLEESSLKIYHWTREQNQWMVLEDSEVNPEDNTVRGSITHFTLFALMGSKISVPEKRKPGEIAFPEEERPKELPKEEIPEEGVLQPEKELEGRVEEVAEEREKVGREAAGFLATIGQFFSGLTLESILYIILIIAIGLLILFFLLRKRRKKIP